MEREIGVERILLRGPSHNIYLCARVAGLISPDSFRKAIEKLRGKHPFLGVRITRDNQNREFFTTDKVPDIPVHILDRKDDSHWLHVVEKEYTIPFDFEKGPLIRFLLLTPGQSSQPYSDIIIFCQHSICDGLSLSYLIEEILSLLDNPEYPMERYTIVPPLTEKTVPGTTRKTIPVKMLFFFINFFWNRKKIYFKEADYQKMFKKFWTRDICILTRELGQNQVTPFFSRCRQEGVSINSAMVAALVTAQTEVQGNADPFYEKTAIPVNLRPRMTISAGKKMGFYSTGLIVHTNNTTDQPFWNLARKIHGNVRNQLKDNRFITMFMLRYLHPSLLDSLFFTKHGGFKDHLAKFVLRLLKWDQMSAGYEISNLGRLEIPHHYGKYRLTAIYHGIYLPRIEKFIGITTIKNTTIMTCTFDPRRIDKATVHKILDRVMQTIRLCRTGHP